MTRQKSTKRKSSHSAKVRRSVRRSEKAKARIIRKAKKPS